MNNGAEGERLCKKSEMKMEYYVRRSLVAVASTCFFAEKGANEAPASSRGLPLQRATMGKPQRTQPRDYLRLWRLCAGGAYQRKGAGFIVVPNLCRYRLQAG